MRLILQNSLCVIDIQMIQYFIVMEEINYYQKKVIGKISFHIEFKYLIYFIFFKGDILMNLLHIISVLKPVPA